MRKINPIWLFAFFAISACSESPDGELSQKDESMRFADSLVAVMSVQEKAGQMTNLSLRALASGEFWADRDSLELDTAKMRKYLSEYGVGSIQNLANYPFSTEEWRRNINLIQEFVAEHSKRRIPILYGIDAVHGANYTAESVLFPHQINLAASFNTELTEAVAAATSYEVRASGIHWNYAPVLDVARNPLWGRTFETFGEDTYLATQMGLAMLNGSVDDSLTGPYSTLACLKHFLAYGAPHNGKDRAPVYLPERELREVHIPPFRAAIDAGALTVMAGSNAVNGVPCHSNYFLLTQLLKEELGFKGFVISDWNDVDNLVNVYQVAKDEKEAVMLAVNAGMDMCMEPYDASFTDHLIELVNEGKVSRQRLDDAVRRILYVKHKMGLFEATQTPPSLYPEFGGEKFTELAYQAAVESITLLKNEKERLPLESDTKILLTGVASHSINYLNGGWSRTWGGKDTTYNDLEKHTIKEALEKELGKTNLRWVEGTSYAEELNIEKAVKAARMVDEIVICLGEEPATEKPSDINELELPDAQTALVKALAETGKPITLVLVQGRPRIIREIEPLADAILMAYLPGNEGGRAVADILLGKEMPGGKLPFTYPKYSGSIWTYDHTKADRRDKGFGFEAFDPQYEFAYGLSYTTFGYENLKLSHDSLSVNDTLRIEVEIKNTGSRKGKEAVTVFLSDEVASIVPAVKELKRFKKVELDPSRSKNIAFRLTTNDLAFVDENNERVIEPGKFTIQIGPLKEAFWLEGQKTTSPNNDI